MVGMDNVHSEFQFENRREAGILLAEQLKPLVLGDPDLLVLGLPRGGVPVAHEVARILQAPLDVLVVRKLGIPGYEETAMGAIASGGMQILDADLVARLGISQEAIGETLRREQAELKRREETYRGDCPPLDVAGRTVILVDDGIATGSTVMAALGFLRAAHAKKVIIAAPVCAPSSCKALAQKADDVICVMAPDNFHAVGLWYEDFSATPDTEVCRLLQSTPHCPETSEQGQGLQRDIVDLVREHAQPLTGDPADYDALLAVIGDSPLVLLGEASHGTHEFYAQRAEITKRLIREKDFDAILIEGDFPDSLLINRYVTCKTADQDSIEALAGFERFPAWMWRNDVMLDFVGWLRDHNEQVGNESGLVNIFGLDLYSMHKSMNHVVSYLEYVDPPAAQRARYRYSCIDRFGEDPQNYGLLVAKGMSHGCEEQVLAQIQELRAKETRYLSFDGIPAKDAHFYAEQNARTVINAEKYYRAMFHSGPQSWNLRDDHMMETLIAINDHLTGQRGKSKLVVWAHNSHLGDARHTSMGYRGERNLGQLVRQKYGNKACLIGMTTYEGTVTAALGWHQPPQRRAVRPGLQGSCEQLFHQVDLADFYLPLGDGNPAAQALVKPLLERAIGVVYRPETERQSHYFTTHLAKQFDAVLHFDRTRAVEPLEKTSQWMEGELPESYPTGI